jgi:hypothetical protein
MYVAQLSALVHSLCVRDFACNMQDAISFRDLFFPLNNSILLQSIGNSVLQMNPYLTENIMDLMIHILSLVVSSEDFDIRLGLCLNQSFDIFEVLKDLRFLPEKVDPSKT